MKRAFSLIELSIVILIIGILIAGVTQGSRLVAEMTLSSARTQTQSSPVNSIGGLVLWLEATGENSFISAEAEDGLPITAWYDTNTQVTSKNHATRSTSDTRVTYERNAINSLPAVFFNGTAGTSSNLAGNVILTANNAFSLFLVSKSTETVTGNWRPVFYNGSATGWGYQKGGNTPAKRDLVFPNIVDSYSASDFTTSSEVISATHNGATSALYVNGLSEGPSVPNATMITPTIRYVVGNSFTSALGTPWMGYIAEIIVFERALKNEERQAIEDYLGKKWGIKVL